MDIDLAGTLLVERYESRKEEARAQAMIAAGVMGGFGGGGSEDYQEVYVDGVRR